MGIALDAETESFARRLATLRGETVEEAVKTAVRAALARTETARPTALSPQQRGKVEKMLAIVKALPELDVPSDLYDESGLPH